MTDFDPLKIPIFPRVNRTPRAPTETRAANATYLLQRWNQLCELLDSEFAQLKSQIDSLEAEVEALKRGGIGASEQSFYEDIPSHDVSQASYEFGIKVRFAKSGFISAIRYLKPAGETGSHVGRIWDAMGTLLASVSFANETTIGWQTQKLETPFAVQTDTDYVISCNSNSVFPFAYVPFSGKSQGDLIAVAEAFGSVGNFPSTSFGNADYFRDLKFKPAG